MPEKLTTSELWLSSLLFGGAAILSLLPLRLLFSSDKFERAGATITISSALLWGVAAVIFMRGYWEIYYRYFYPSWMRTFLPLSFLLYAGFGFGLWWLSYRLHFPPLLTFVVLGGVEGVLEHLFAIYALGILEKVPFLGDLKVVPIIIFSFFEYALYWSVVAWITLGAMHLMRIARP